MFCLAENIHVIHSILTSDSQYPHSGVVGFCCTVKVKIVYWRDFPLLLHAHNPFLYGNTISNNKFLDCFCLSDTQKMDTHITIQSPMVT